VAGVPLARRASWKGRLDWPTGRAILADLADELAAATADGTLPAGLSLDQVWVDRAGRAKLLDAPLIEGTGTDAAAQHAPAQGTVSDEAPQAAAVAVLRQATRLCTEGLVLPGRAEAFVAELAARAGDRSTLVRATARLAELAHHQAALRWDDRLGVMAVSWGIETTVYMLASFVGTFVAQEQAWMPPSARLALVAAVALGLPAAIGAASRGGPVFRLLGIEVRRRRGGAASRLRCAWRNVCTWAPLSLGFTGIAAIAAAVPDRWDASQGAVHVEGELALLFAGAACGWGLGFLIFLTGGLLAVLFPARGPQDVLAGTRLVPE
jgi:hypothetical protein